MLTWSRPMRRGYLRNGPGRIPELGLEGGKYDATNRLRIDTRDCSRAESWLVAGFGGACGTSRGNAGRLQADVCGLERHAAGYCRNRGRGAPVLPVVGL